MFINAKNECERVENRRCYALISSLGFCLELAKYYLQLEKKSSFLKDSEHAIYLNLQKIVNLYKQIFLETLMLMNFYSGTILDCVVSS